MENNLGEGLLLLLVIGPKFLVQFQCNLIFARSADRTCIALLPPRPCVYLR